MFWNKKKKLPVTIDDKLWIEESFLFLQEILGLEHFNSLETITPEHFKDYLFKGNENDADFVLERVKELMVIDDSSIRLEYFSDEPAEMSDGTILTTPADIHGKWESVSGIYEEKEKVIYIERGQLKNPISLIATMAHELSHFILLGENRIEENDEYLTDLTAIVYGFGIFLGNSKFQHQKFQNINTSGWQISSQGYLPEQIIAYSMVLLSIQRKENTAYKNLLNKDLARYFNQSLEFLQSDKEK
jgi:hypothetical protein